jgi:hypothetical protein
MTVIAQGSSALVVAANPRAAFVAAGAQGIPGPGLNILGYYATLPLLIVAHPAGAPGDAYAVGTSVYYWGGTAWLTNGQIHVPLLEVSGPLDLELVMDDGVPGPGWPVCVSRANGHGRLARADSYALSFVAGLSKAAATPGFVCALEQFRLDLGDWTEAAGTPALAQGAPYFLGPAGGLAAVPDLTAAAVALVGTAASPSALRLASTPPILL